VTSTSWLYISQGRSKELLLTSVIHACVMIASFVAGLRFGPTGVAIAYSASGVLIQLPVTCYIAGRRGAVSGKEHGFAFLRQLPLCLAVLGVTSLAAWSTVSLAPFTRLLICIPAGLLASATGILLFPATRRTTTAILAALNDLRTGRSGSC
jgi:hypothetical protein